MAFCFKKKFRDRRNSNESHRPLVRAIRFPDSPFLCTFAYFLTVTVAFYAVLFTGIQFHYFIKRKTGNGSNLILFSYLP